MSLLGFDATGRLAIGQLPRPSGPVVRANHYLSLAFLPKLQYGTRPIDFITGTSSNTAATVELRMDDLAGYSREDMLIQLEALQRFFENGQEVIGAGFVLKVK